jgi:hypothetical protein
MSILPMFKSTYIHLNPTAEKVCDSRSNFATNKGNISVCMQSDHTQYIQATSDVIHVCYARFSKTLFKC